MKNDFVETRVTLLQRIAMEKTGEDEATWARFFELYYPAMEMFARRIGGGTHAEDIAQDVLVKLVGVLREGRYEKRDGKSFRGYVKSLIRNQLTDLYRREKARGYGRNVELNEEVREKAAADTPDVGVVIDLEWAMARRAAACDHVLTKTAMSAQSKAVYRAYALEEKPLEDVARQYGLSKNAVSQIKTRVDRMISAKLAECEG